jgi:N-acetylmuramoyl-L-alanine amidase
MEQWSAREGLKLLPQSASGRKYYQLHCERGDLVFMDGSQTAYWNGQALMLSFAPQTTRNRPYMHRSDLQHTVIPLLSKCAGGSHEGKILLLDPGHGGSDPGSRTVVGSRSEKDLTLDWGLRVRALLTNQGWRVFMTRTNDVEVSLSNRVAMADSLHADLFVSLHFNSFSNSEYAGLETFCMTPAGMPSNLVRGPENDLAMPNNAFDDENLRWAMRLHEALVRGVRMADRGVRRARFLAVLRYQKCPAVLIEGGYLSNRQEAAKLGSEAYREQLAEALVKALTKNE